MVSVSPTNETASFRVVGTSGHGLQPDHARWTDVEVGEITRGAPTIRAMPEPALDRAAAALREFLHRSGALRAQALVDVGPDGPPALVACSRLGPIEIVVGDRELELPHGIELDAEPPDLGDVRQMPPFEISVERGEVTGTIGGLQHLAAAVSRLAEAIGGRTVAVVEFQTTSADVPLALSTRSGESVVVTLGDETYEI